MTPGTGPQGRVGAPFDLLIRRAQLRQRAQLADIGIADGKIAAIEPRLTGAALQEIDAAGRLVTEPFVDCHFHIDKSFSGAALGRFQYPLRPLPDPERTLTNKPHSGLLDYTALHSNVLPMEYHWSLKRTYTVDNVAQRVERALELALLHGTLAMRMFVDVDSIQGLTALRGTLKARERFANTMMLQVCAFPQEGLFTDPGASRLMEEAMDMGADIVGGIPWVEWDDEKARAHIDLCFALAKRHDRDVHMLCDDTPNPYSRTLEMVAVRAMGEEYHGRVTSSHNGALRHYPEAHALRVIGLLRQAGVNIVANPNVNALGTLTRVAELLAAGVNVCSGQDDLDNLFYPLGRADMLESMHFMVHMARLATPMGLETAFDIVTHNGARALRLDSYGLTVGSQANMLVFDGRNLQEVLQMQADRNYVIARGRVVATTNRQRHVAPIGGL